VLIRTDVLRASLVSWVIADEVGRLFFAARFMRRAGSSTGCETRSRTRPNGAQRHDEQPTHGICEDFLARPARPDQDNPHARRPDAVGDFDILAREVCRTSTGSTLRAAEGYRRRCLVGGPACVPRQYLTGIPGQRHRRWMNELLVGYARGAAVSTRSWSDRRCVDYGLTGVNLDRPRLRLDPRLLPSRDMLVITSLIGSALPPDLATSWMS
jgi:hypothetical protein